MDGKKNDTGKLPLEFLPLDAIEAEAEVLQFGASKYDARNWEKGMRWGRLYGAVLRHLFAWWRGEAKDPETGLSHLATHRFVGLRPHRCREPQRQRPRTHATGQTSSRCRMGTGELSPSNSLKP